MDILVTALTLSLSASATGAPFAIRGGAAEIVWTNSYRSDGEDWINDIAPMRDGSFLAVGFLNRVDGDAPSDWRALASRFGGDGAVSWTREYGAGGAIDAFWTAREREDGALAFAGLTTRVGPGGINAYVAVTDEAGAILKENGYGAAGYDTITGLARTADGFIGAGHAEGLDGRDVLLVGLDRDGIEIWRKIFAEKGSNGALYIEPAGDGAFIVAGGSSPDGTADMLVIKVDAQGGEIWRRMIGDPQADDINHGLAALADGRIALAGYTNGWGAGEHDLMLAILGADGETLSIEIIGGAGDERARSLKADGEGKLWIVGHSSSGGGDQDGLIVRASGDGRFDGGALLLGGDGADVASAIQPLGGDAILVGGYGGDATPDAYVARLSKIRLKAQSFLAARKVK